MGRSIRQIQQELDNIQETVTEAARELEALYDKYVINLSQSAQKQLILAGYQLCTQIYPEAFINMSLSQRQKLQQALRQLAREMELSLQKKPTSEDLNQEQADLNLIAEMLKNLPVARSSNEKLDEEKPTELEQDNSGNITDQNLESVTAIMMSDDENDGDNTEIAVGEIREFSLESLQNLANRETDVNKIKEIDLSNPQHLMLWHKKIEHIIKKALDDTSRKANKSLQKFHVLPNRLPSKVIDVALQAGDAAGNSKLRKVPNILNLTIETDKNKKEPKYKNAAQISLLRLRLSELEFVDPQLSSQRNQIRAILKKVKKLGSLYRERKKEYAIAEADAAWRSSWYED